jgi:hypothetical protein
MNSSDGARETPTLRQPAYPGALYQLASRIVNEVMGHFERFHAIGLVVREYPVENAPYLHSLTLARPVDPAIKDALALHRGIISELTKAYAAGRVEDRAAIIQARDAMTKPHDVADGLGGRGVGVPFF